MTDTDTAALQERIARALAGASYVEGPHAEALFRDEAAAVLPIVEAEVQAAKADAWAVGYGAGQSDARHHARGPSRTINPYRQEQTNE